MISSPGGIGLVVATILATAAAVKAPGALAKRVIVRFRKGSEVSVTSPATDDAIAPIVASWRRVRTAAMLANLALDIPLWWIAGALFGQTCQRSIPSGARPLVPAVWMFLVPALATGFALGAYAADSAVRRAIDIDTYRQVVEKEARSIPLDYKIFATLMSAATFVIGIVAMVLLGDSYVYLDANRLIVNRFLRFGETGYSCSAVVGIYTAPVFVAPNGRFVDRRLYSIRLRDRTAWTTNDDPSGSADAAVAVVRRLSAQCSIPIEDVAVLDRSYF